jgi:hypothetical protein
VKIAINDTEEGLEGCPEEPHGEGEGWVGEGDYLEGFDVDYAYYYCDAGIVSLACNCVGGRLGTYKRPGENIETSPSLHLRASWKVIM